MIQIFLKDLTNPYRQECCVFNTINPVKASAFIRGMNKVLNRREWMIKTKIGDIYNDPDLLLKFGSLYKDNEKK
jgi:hypothetical protein